MCSFIEVSKKVYQREYETDLDMENYDNEVRKRHKGYFNEIANALMIEKELPKLKKDKNFVFKEQGAKLLEDLLYQYGQSMKRKKRSDVSKNLEKQIFKCDQYNAFLQEDILEVFDDMISANNLVIEALECFYQLFRERDVTETEVGKILGKANTKYSYPKRKYFQEIIELFREYIQKLDDVNKQRHEVVGLTEQENAAWLEYSNNEIRKVMEKILKVRENMEEENKQELKKDVFNQFMTLYTKGYDMDDIDKCRKMEEELREKCRSNEEVRELLKEYNRITEKELNFEQLVSIVVVHDSENYKENEDLIMREVLTVPTDGNIKLSQMDVQRIREILESLYIFVVQEKNNYRWPYLWEKKRASRESNPDLLDKAIRMLDTPQ